MFLWIKEDSMFATDEDIFPQEPVNSDMLLPNSAQQAGPVSRCESKDRLSSCGPFADFELTT